MADTNLYTIKIRAEGAAFADDEAYEVSLILGRLEQAVRAGRLPEALLDSNGNSVGTIDLSVEKVPDLESMCWADLLDRLPTFHVSQTADLRVDDGELRVWLARTDALGEPFRRTVYVEEQSDGSWWEVGYFDGDEPDPNPSGVLANALDLTIQTVREAEA